MVPIVISEDKKFNEESFKEYLVDTCRKHKTEGRALAFAFIVYDFDNHTITQILKKEDYWNSLDKISGKTLSVFYINSQESYFQRRQQEIYQDELRQRENFSKKGYISFLVPLTLKSTPFDNAIGLIKEEFEVEDTLKQPFVLFFQIDREDISDFFVVSLKQDRLEEAFLELRDHIRNAVNALSKVNPENFDNHQEIFNLIKDGVERGKFNDFVKKQITSKSGIGTIISLIKLIAGAKLT